MDLDTATNDSKLNPASHRSKADYIVGNAAYLAGVRVEWSTGQAIEWELLVAECHPNLATSVVRGPSLVGGRVWYVVMCMMRIIR